MTRLATGGFEGRRIVVAGGASGIGRATSLLLAEQGARVAILDRDAAGIVAAETGGHGVVMDVVESASVAAAFEAAAHALGGIDGLVNTVGVFDPAPFSATDEALWSRLLSVNLTGTFLVCHHALPYLRESGSATIVTVSSGVALLPTGTAAAYAASKGGVVALSRSLAAEVAPQIRVNCVCPGLVDTPMAKGQMDRPEVQARVSQAYALRRIAAAEEVAAAIVFLSGAGASFITGTTLAVDGGRSYY